MRRGYQPDKRTTIHSSPNFSSTRFRISTSASLASGPHGFNLKPGADPRSEGHQAYGAARIHLGFGIADCDGGKKSDGDFRHHSCGPRMKIVLVFDLNRAFSGVPGCATHASP
jgi:hypothetical protein